MTWLLVVAVLIVIAFGVVLWRTFDPKRKAELDEEAELPLHDAERTNLDDEG